MRTRLRSKFTLILVAVVALLLVVGGTAMAVITDTSGNTAPAPTIQSDQADYPPGATVTLTGSGWQPGEPGESVDIVVNDDEGQTWSHTATVTADASGNITDSFTLPDWFVATYSVKATGSSGAVATTSFTDSNVEVGSNAPLSGPLPTDNRVQWKRYNTTDCSGSVQASGSLTLNGSANGQIPSGANSNQSIRLTASAQSSDTTPKPFNNWVPSDKATSNNYTVVGGTGGKEICTFGYQNGSGGGNVHVYTAYYGNTAPSTPGTPSASPNPNNGQFTLTWTASTDTEGNPITYGLERKLASDPVTSYSLVPNAGSLNTNSFSFTSGAEENAGTWTYRVQASDGSLTSAFSASSPSVTVDKTAPNVTLTQVNNQTVTSFPYSTNQNVSQVGGACTTGDGQVRVTSNGNNLGGLVNCSSGTWSLTLSGGSMLTNAQTYTLVATQTDAAGNTGSSGSKLVTIDKTAPAAPVITNPANNSFNNTGNVTVSGTAEANSTVELFDGPPIPTNSKGTTTANASGNWSKSLSGVADGPHPYQATATDAAGNTSASSPPRLVIVDTVQPNVTINTPADGATYTQGTTVNASYTCADNTGGSGLKTTGGCVGTVANGAAIDTATTGSKSFTVTATDNANNTKSVTNNYTVVPANNAPSKPGTPSASSNPNNGEFTLNWTASSDDDKPDPPKAVTYTLQHKNSASGANFTNVATGLNTNSYTFGPNSKETEGTWTYQVIATDSALSTTSDASSAIKVDRSGPNAPTLSFNTSASQSLKATVGSVDWYKDSALIDVASNGDKTLADGSAGSGVKAASLLPNPFSVTTNGTSTATRTVEDNVGNVSSPSTPLSVHVDANAPTSSFGSASTADGPYSAGTYANKDVTVTLNANDGESGVEKIVYRIDSNASYQDYPAGGITVSQDGTTTIDFHAVDKVGHVEASDNHYTVKVDQTDPNLSCNPSSAPTGWQADNVTFNCSASDSGSGLAANQDLGTDGSFTLSTSVADNTENANASTGQKTVTDVAGNSATIGPFTGIQVDRKAPNTSADTGTYNGGWTNQNVTVTLNANDGGSGVKKIEYSIDGGSFQAYPNGGIIVSNDGDHTILYRSTDNVDNQEQDHSLTVKVDKTPPEFTCDQPDGNWHADNVTLHCTASDGASGLANGSPASFDLSTDVAAGNETDNASTNSQPLSDVAGNSVTAGPIDGNKVDRKAPEVVPGDVTDTTWRNASLSKDFTATDGGSGLANTADSSFTLTASAESANASTPTVVFRDVKDAVGNTTKRSVSALIDLHNPNISASVLNQPDANTGWYNLSTGGPQVHFDCNDALSGIQSCPPNHTVTDQGPNVTYKGTAHDVAGNSAEATAGPFQIDLTAPAAAGAPDLLASSDSGVQDDNVTNVKAPTFDITAEAGSTVKLYAKKDGNETFIGQATATNGTARIQSNQQLTDGQYDVYAHVIDQAGNESDTSVLHITIVTIDSTAPVPPGLSMDAASDTGVSNSDKKTNNDKPTFNGTAEAGSTLKLYDGTNPNPLTTITVTDGTWSFTLTTALSEGTHTIKATATDAANNTSNEAQLSDVVIDKTAPAANCGTAPSTWSKLDVSIRCQPTDALSGLADPTNDGDFNLTTNVPDGTETDAASTGSRTVNDAAGNSVTAGPFTSLKVDKKAPSISYVGQTAASANFNVAGSNNWYIKPVQVSFSASDGGSGVAASVTSPFNKDSGTQEGSAVKIASGAVSDAVGNTAPSIDSTATFKVDLSNPSTPTFSGILAQIYPIANVPAQSTISCSATDAISPADPNTGFVGCGVTGYSNTIGSHILTATATDQAGRQSTNTLTYTVGLQVGEVLSPINSLNKANLAATNLDVFKIKSTIPVKFKLYNDTAKTQLMTSPPAGSVARITFLKQDSTTDSTDAVDALPSSTPNTDNIYRWTGSPDNQYIYNLATTGKAAGTYSVQLTLYESSATNATVLAQSAKYYFVLRS